MRNGPRPKPPNWAKAPAAANRQATAAARMRACRRSATARSALWIELVAHPRLGDEIPRVGRIGLELLAELSHEHAQVLRLFLRGFAPDGFEQRPVRQHAARVPGHVEEQLEFLRRQP